MNLNKEDGGHAMPTGVWSDNKGTHRGGPGFSKREAYALAAMQAIISKLPLRAAGIGNEFGLPNDEPIKLETAAAVASGAFLYAEAMLAYAEAIQNAEHKHEQ